MRVQYIYFFFNFARCTQGTSHNAINKFNKQDPIAIASAKHAFRERGAQWIQHDACVSAYPCENHRLIRIYVVSTKLKAAKEINSGWKERRFPQKQQLYVYIAAS